MHQFYMLKKLQIYFNIVLQIDHSTVKGLHNESIKFYYSNFNVRISIKDLCEDKCEYVRNCLNDFGEVN